MGAVAIIAAVADTTVAVAMWRHAAVPAAAMPLCEAMHHSNALPLMAWLTPTSL